MNTCAELYNNFQDLSSIYKPNFFGSWKPMWRVISSCLSKSPGFHHASYTLDKMSSQRLLVSKHIDVQYIKLYISNKLNKDDFCFKKMMIITVIIKYGSCHFWTKWVKWRLESLVYRNTSMNFWSPFPWKIRKLYMICCDGTWQNMIMVIALSMYVGSTILCRSLLWTQRHRSPHMVAWFQIRLTHYQILV